MIAFSTITDLLHHSNTEICHRLFQCEKLRKIGGDNRHANLGCTEMRALVEKVDFLGCNKS